MTFTHFSRKISRGNCSWAGGKNNRHGYEHNRTEGTHGSRDYEVPGPQEFG